MTRGGQPTVVLSTHATKPRVGDGALRSIVDRVAFATKLQHASHEPRLEPSWLKSSMASRTVIFQGSRHSRSASLRRGPPSPHLDGWQRECERQVIIEEHQATLPELGKDFLDTFYWQA
jgi:hypothetical protein